MRRRNQKNVRNPRYSRRWATGPGPQGPHEVTLMNVAVPLETASEQPGLTGNLAIVAHSLSKPAQCPKQTYRPHRFKRTPNLPKSEDPDECYT